MHIQGLTKLFFIVCMNAVLFSGNLSTFLTLFSFVEGRCDREGAVRDSFFHQMHIFQGLLMNVSGENCICPRATTKVFF